MKRVYSMIGLVVAVAACGCQQQTESQPVSKQPVSQQTDAQASTAQEPDDDGADSETADAAEASATTGTNDIESAHNHDEPGPGRGMGRGMGRGAGGMGGMRPDMSTIHAMFASRDKIQRTVRNLPNGAEAITESDDGEIVALIQEHVPAVEARVLENKPLPPMTFHPIFVNLIKHSEDYTLDYEETDKGMKVTYVAQDPYVVMLVQEHAKLVSRFLKNGMSEIHKEYKLPKLPAPEKK